MYNQFIDLQEFQGSSEEAVSQLCSPPLLCCASLIEANQIPPLL